MVGAGTDYPDLDTVLRVPLEQRADSVRVVLKYSRPTYPSETVENIDVLARVQVVNGAFTVNFERVWAERGE